LLDDIAPKKLDRREKQKDVFYTEKTRRQTAKKIGNEQKARSNTTLQKGPKEKKTPAAAELGHWIQVLNKKRERGRINRNKKQRAHPQNQPKLKVIFLQISGLNRYPITHNAGRTIHRRSPESDITQPKKKKEKRTPTDTTESVKKRKKRAGVEFVRQYKPAIKCRQSQEQEIKDKKCPPRIKESKRRPEGVRTSGARKARGNENGGRKERRSRPAVKLLS